MGEAKRRARQYEEAKTALLEDLSGDARIVADTSIAFFERFILPRRYIGGCYLTTMFLDTYLREERGVTVTPVVGYVNDGTDDIMISHAWIELDGRKTDLTLAFVEYGHAGPLLVLDRELRPGAVQYSYHREQTNEGRAQYAALMDDPRMRPIVIHKEQEHADMLARIGDPAMTRAHMDAAPPGLRYEDLRDAIA